MGMVIEVQMEQRDSCHTLSQLSLSSSARPVLNGVIPHSPAL